MSNTSEEGENKLSCVSEDDNEGILTESRVGPEAFIAHSILGKGSFGEVYLVEKKDSGSL